jgi:hypothetical protein
MNYEVPHVLDLGALLADESSALAGRHQQAQLQVHVAFRGSRPAGQNTKLVTELPQNKNFLGGQVNAGNRNKKVTTQCIR